MNTETKNCQNCKNKFVIEPEDFAFYEKIDVPPPTWCAECREIRRIVFRNERSLYHRECNMCKKKVISRVSPDKPYPMYCRDCWWSDAWDGISFGKDYDFSKPFFAQFKELLFRTPHISLFNSNTINSDWVNQETDDKNCYLNVGGHYNEDSAYNTYEIFGKQCFDNFWLLNSELCYENINCERCYRTLYSELCFDSLDTVLSYDCRNCQFVFGCAGLRNKKYCIFNKQVTKEEYETFLQKNPILSRKTFLQLKKRAHEIWALLPRRYAMVVKCTDCSGNFLHESKDAKNSWNTEKCEHVKNLYIGGWMKDSYDLSAHGASELNYECASGGGVYQSKFLNFCMANDPIGGLHSSYLHYCYAVVSSENCFGCVNLRNKKILYFEQAVYERRV